MNDGYLKFNQLGRVEYKIHVADFSNIEGNDNLFPVPPNYTTDNEYALIDGNVVKVGAPPTQFHEWSGTEYILDTVKMAESFREQRAIMLSASDWTQLPDVDTAIRELWRDYRQALRDLTSQPGFPEDTIWPIPPV